VDVGLGEAASSDDGKSGAADGAGPQEVKAALQPFLPDYAPADETKGWSELGLDSFDLLSLRLAIEERAGAEISDQDWVEAATPAALARLAASPAPPPRERAGAGARLHEAVELGMPEMALSGLSESWLMKALGDWHWRMTAASLGTRTVDMRDGSGARLFPAFTRIRFVSSAPLAAYEEGERLGIDAALTRYGSGIFFSRIAIDGGSGRTIMAELMSSFASRPGTDGSARALRRGEPVLPDPCDVPAHFEMPSFGVEFARRRLAKDAARPVLARAPYALVPHYDINGLGLLYCAAYPLIADTCQMRARADGDAWAARTSTIERDVCYFANADGRSPLEWRLYSDEAGDGLATEASIARSDGATMALVSSRKALL
jgi:probable biosynthetic protein (TIGR04098 family)